MTMSGETTFIVFEGGAPEGPVDASMRQVRAATALDTIERLTTTFGDEISLVLVTDNPEVAAGGQALGAETLTVGPPLSSESEGFHFGRALTEVVNELKLDRVICFGGGSAPLYSADQWLSFIEALNRGPAVVVQNNPGSADVFGFRPAAAINGINPPIIDNFLGSLLRETGLERILPPNAAELHFDIDVPTDVQILKVVGPQLVGRRTAALLGKGLFSGGSIPGLASSLWERGRGGRELDLCLVGRVDVVTEQFLRANFPVRINSITEGKGLRRAVIENRPVPVITSEVVKRCGFQCLFEILSEGVDYIVMDWRPLLAALGEFPGAEDRFNADLLQLDHVVSPVLRDLVSASLEAEANVILGGHSLVSGGLWLLAKHILAQAGIAEWRPGGRPR